MADFAHFSTKYHAKKIPWNRNPRQDPARNMVKRRGAVVRVEFWRGALLHNECTMAIFSEGGCNNHPFGFQRQRLDLPSSIFRLNFFECAVAVFLRCGGGSKMNMMGIIIWKLIHCRQATVTIHTENDSEASSAYRAGPGTMVYP